MNLLTNNYGVPDLDFEVGILSKREIEIIERSLLLDKNIAWDLGISYHTVVAHLRSIRNKTGLHGGKQLVYFGMKQGLIN